MADQVIHIYGASGSGTTTFGKYICEKTGFYFMDTDDYFWEPTNPPYTTKRDVSKRLELMKNDISKWGRAVISGSLVDWGDELIPIFTLAVRLKTDTSIRIERLKKRERKEFGSSIDIGGDMYEIYQEFIEYAASYDGGGLDMRSRAKHDEWQKLLRCKQIELNGSNTLEHNFEIVQNYLYYETGRTDEAVNI